MHSGDTQQDHTATAARDFLRRHTAGVLECDGVYTNIRYVLGADGAPVTSGPAGFLTAEQTVLFVPADVPDVLELLVTVEAESGESADADRWRIYHGKSNDPAFYRLLVDAGKWRTHVFEGEELMQSNPLAPVEPALCKWMNTDHRPDLMAMSLRFNGVEIDEALLVGVDLTGFDIRAKAGIIRIDAPERIEDQEQARAVLEQMRRQALGDLS